MKTTRFRWCALALAFAVACAGAAYADAIQDKAVICKADAADNIAWFSAQTAHPNTNLPETQAALERVLQVYQDLWLALEDLI